MQGPVLRHSREHRHASSFDDLLQLIDLLLWRSLLVRGFCRHFTKSSDPGGAKMGAAGIIQTDQRKGLSRRWKSRRAFWQISKYADVGETEKGRLAFQTVQISERRTSWDGRGFWLLEQWIG